MYRGFVIKKSTIDNLPPLNCGLQARTEYENTFSSIEEDKKLQRKAIKTEILGHNGIIDADKLMQACMPQTHDFNIFISHSHKDFDYAQKLASYIFKKFGLTSKTLCLTEYH